MREVRHRYVDPLELIWRHAADALGLTIVRSADAFASTDGRGTLVLGSDDTLDADDCVAQMVLHELCHALVQGPAAFAQPDWGLDNESTRDVAREHACLRVQAALLAPHGLREVFAPTTDFRSYYDALADDPLEGAPDEVATLARAALSRAAQPPWSDALAGAIGASAAIVRVVRDAGASSMLVDGVPPLYRARDR